MMMYLLLAPLILLHTFCVNGKVVNIPSYGIPAKQKRVNDECRKILSDPECHELHALVEHVMLPASAVRDALIDASFQGAKTRDEIYLKANQYLNARMLCDMMLTEKLCLRLVEASLDNKVPYHEVDGALQALTLNGLEDKKVIFGKLIKFINENANDEWPLASYEDEQRKWSEGEAKRVVVKRVMEEVPL